MPKQGYKSITVSEATLKKLAEIAETLHKSIPEVILYLCDVHSGVAPP